MKAVSATASGGIIRQLTGPDLKLGQKLPLNYAYEVGYNHSGCRYGSPPGVCRAATGQDLFVLRGPPEHTLGCLG